ncbi:hypothetical protein [Deinococcus sp.]|uniref:hypothetical protein n=1 Tax=Deinococcus sp. TaxID=47478 RepID=UPI003C7E5AFD
MNKIIPTILFALISSSFAAPLVGSKQSVSLSNFCKKYSCKLTYSGPIKGAGDSRKGYKEFIYSLNSNISVDVTRDPDNTINGASLDYNEKEGLIYAFKNDGGSYVNDFTLSFAGFKPQASINTACINPLNNGEDYYAFGMMGDNGPLKIRCGATITGPSGTPARTHAGVVVSR